MKLDTLYDLANQPCWHFHFGEKILLQNGLLDNSSLYHSVRVSGTNLDLLELNYNLWPTAVVRTSNGRFEPLTRPDFVSLKTLAQKNGRLD